MSDSPSDSESLRRIAPGTASVDASGGSSRIRNASMKSMYLIAPVFRWSTHAARSSSICSIEARCSSVSVSTSYPPSRSMAAWNSPYETTPSAFESKERKSCSESRLRRAHWRATVASSCSAHSGACRTSAAASAASAVTSRYVTCSRASREEVGSCVSPWPSSVAASALSDASGIPIEWSTSTSTSSSYVTTPSSFGSKKASVLLRSLWVSASCSDESRSACHPSCSWATR
mmetsp:Transcript_45312/g.145809  ORF Transcript_45312/g.145809 Transcript_45312/m.145809 type:complete len:232 (-) Transcript_45312:660-1355(-)